MPVHPHTRGDNSVSLVSYQLLTGTPPHAWGQFNSLNFLFARFRYTPTRVGTMYFLKGKLIDASVHPHTRGDNSKIYIFFCDSTGTPPHAWGQFSRFFFNNRFLRYTPTRVGTMLIEFFKPVIVSVHPHTRGDNYKIKHIVLHSSGTPPHAWGQLTIEQKPIISNRYTPTRVGTMYTF